MHWAVSGCGVQCCANRLTLLSPLILCHPFSKLEVTVCYSGCKMLTGLAGSMGYVAPEILADKGYLSTIDWWSFGGCT